MQPHPERRKQLVDIERRSWHLWAISLTIMCALAFGITLLLFPVIGGYVKHLEIERKSLPQLVFGLLIIVVLSGVYMVIKQRQLNSMRNYIIASYVSAGFPAEDYPHDALTGALDRSALPDLLKNHSAQADRVNGPFCALILDINHFRRINEREGNLVGDLVLKEFVLMLQRTIRQHDTLVRYGPDEFLCLLSGSPREGGEVFVRRVEKGCERVPRLRGLTFTAGLAEYQAGASPEDVVADAERNLTEKSRPAVPTISSQPPA